MALAIGSNRFAGVTEGIKVAVKLFISAVFALVMAGASFADVNRTISKEFVIVQMNTPRAWSYLKNMKYNPIASAMLGGLAPCDGTLDVIFSERGEQKVLLFTFTSAKTSRSVTYVIADVKKFVAGLNEGLQTRPSEQNFVLCHEGVDMTDGSRSNYILKYNKSIELNFLVELDRSDIGILLPLPNNVVKAILALR